MHGILCVHYDEKMELRWPKTTFHVVGCLCNMDKDHSQENKMVDATDQKTKYHIVMVKDWLLWPTTKMPQHCGKNSSDQLPKKKKLDTCLCCAHLHPFSNLVALDLGHFTRRWNTIWWMPRRHVHVIEDDVTISRDIAQTL